MVDKNDVAAVLELIRPSLQADGGDVRFVDVDEDGVVSVELQGACKGCPMSEMTLANGVDLLIAKTGMARLNYDPNNGYVEKYLFGSGFEVHSVLGDQWIRFGLVGMLFAVACVVVVWRGTLADLGRNAASALLLYLALSCAWDLLFSPFYSVSATVLMLGVAIATPSTRCWCRSARARACRCRG